MVPRRFMEYDEMDYMDAVAAAVSKRKYLLNRLFDLQHFPEDTASTKTWRLYTTTTTIFIEIVHTTYTICTVYL